MSIGANILLAATTSATQSLSFTLKLPSEGQQATIIVSGLTSTNKAYLQIYNDVTSSYVNVKINGSEVYCDVNNNVIFVSGNGLYRIDKQGSDSVGVGVISDKEYNII